MAGRSGLRRGRKVGRGHVAEDLPSAAAPRDGAQSLVGLLIVLPDLTSPTIDAAGARCQPASGTATTDWR